ncbi:hypothetical protein ACE1SV_58270 [Streptomyces sp. E-15]
MGPGDTFSGSRPGTGRPGAVADNRLGVPRTSLAPGHSSPAPLAPDHPASSCPPGPDQRTPTPPAPDPAQCAPATHP